MSSPENTGSGACLSDTALEEWAVRHGRADAPAPIKDHLRACPDCAARFEQACKETNALRAALTARADSPETACVDEETLALYLDRGLDEADHDAVETHLVQCRSCQRVLVAMYRELRVVADPDAPLDLPRQAPAEPIPFVERERVDRPAPALGEAKTESAPEQPQEGAEQEKRKRRYLSR